MLLVEASGTELVVGIVTSLIGVISVSSGAAGFFVRPHRRPERWLLALGGLMVVGPYVYAKLARLAIVCLVATTQLVQTRRFERKAHPSNE